MTASQLQNSGMLSREQLLYLFTRFSDLISQPDVKQRIVDAVNEKQEAVAVTTAIQEGIFLEMGVVQQVGDGIALACYDMTAYPRFGISCLGKVNLVYENDQDLMMRFYEFVADEEMACDEAELGPDGFAEKIRNQQELEGQQLEMLTHMRKFHLDDQSAILEKLHQEMENADFVSEASVLTSEQIEGIVRRRVSPLFSPR
ncbi:hypothetical protein Tsubulata_035759 [Turnera subulata]|uniref:Uncharacterized protein n=1 Tax=Turnera subulata TaxID=218843 RepID=A0A9Q0FEX4_9ROSI|nr:hypothetical protein Tsubulata_035759 [Turnera subulata]